MEWTLSGRRGWDKDIYGVSAPEGGEDAPVNVRGDFAEQREEGDDQLKGDVVRNGINQ